jgi:RimJ/RimL family protein N-acetyltransferase
MIKAPQHFETDRLSFRRPHADDAAAIFERYANDAEVTRFLGWPRHRSVDETRAFLRFSDAQWKRWPAGPYLILTRDTGALVGSTGFGFETPSRAVTGYVLARDAWGFGYATEALQAMTTMAPRLGIHRLYALCHPDHRASRRVLEKGGFEWEGVLRRHGEFPNLKPGVRADVLCYARTF